MNISAYSIKNPIPAIVLFGLLTLSGLLAFNNSKVQDFPDIELPVVVVTANLAGASPAQLETDVARKIENAIASITLLKRITTTIVDGVATIAVEFRLEKSVSDAENDVRSAVSRVRSELPADMKEPVVAKVATTGRPIATYVVKATHQDLEGTSWLVDNEISKAVLSLKGVGKFERLGGNSREIAVTLDPDKMLALGVTAANVSTVLKRVQLESGAGRVDLGTQRLLLRAQGTAPVASALMAMQIPLANGGYVKLGEIASVEDTLAEAKSMAFWQGQPVVGFEVTRAKGESEVDLHQRMQAFVAAYNQSHPTVQITEAFNNVDPVQENFDGSMMLLYEGALLAIIVVQLFLRDIRATLISAVALPLSVIPTFLGMAYFDFTLNTVTLLSLALVVGILVDDAIVEVENIERHLRMGKPPMQAAREAADEIGMAVIATTFALVAVFLPTAFMSGVAGKFFKQFGWTAVFAILASLAVARMLTPMMAAYLMKPAPEHTKPTGWLMRVYLRLVAWSVRFRWFTIVLAVGFFIGSLALIPMLPKGFVPSADRSQTMVNIELPPGSSLEESVSKATEARALLSKLSDIKTIFTNVGGGSTGDGFVQMAVIESRKITMTLNLRHRTERSYSQQVIETRIREVMQQLSGVRVTVGPQDTGVKMQLLLQGEDPAILRQAAIAVERDLRTLHGIGNVFSNASLARPEIKVIPDFAKAALAGVTTQEIADTLRIATNGDYDINLPKLNLAQRQVPIKLKFPDSYRDDVEKIRRIRVRGQHGPVEIGELASLQISSGEAQIDRVQRIRTVTLDVELGQSELGAVYDQAMQLPAIANLPAGVKLVESADTEQMTELFGSFGLAMLIGVVCIYVVLVLLFKRFLHPFTILIALPLSIGGAFVLLLVTGKSFSMPSLIGLLMLMGIASKNSILLVEYALEAQASRPDVSRLDALLEACQKRARPIIMTTLAMGAGMLPIAMGLGADPSFRAPMAIAVIGGLVTSTLLSLLVIPAFYSVIDDIPHACHRIAQASRGLMQKKPAQ